MGKKTLKMAKNDENQLEKGQRGTKSDIEYQKFGKKIGKI